MSSLFNIYKKTLITLFGVILAVSSAYAVEEIVDTEITEITEKEVMEAPLEEALPENSVAYINDIEILGSNIIKPEFILKKLQLKNGSIYDKDVMQKDLKTIYKLGYFTERMKAMHYNIYGAPFINEILMEQFHSKLF